MKKLSLSILPLLLFCFNLFGQNKLNRPQTPLEPFPYHSEEVKFENSTDGIILAGTFTYPKKTGTFPAVILISGSGPNDRNFEYLEHKSFLVMADFLTKNGIAVLRYDKRGVNQSGGKYEPATSLDFAKDTEYGIAYLKTRKEVNKKKIGLIGHSEGGIIAPIVAEKSKDVRYIILLGGPTIKGDKLLLLQDKLISKSLGETQSNIDLADEMNTKAYAIATSNIPKEDMQKNLRTYLKETYKNNPSLKKPEKVSEEDFIAREIKFYTDNWSQFYIRYDPVTALKKVNIPLLALYGSKDLQVPAKENVAVLESLATEKKNFDIKVIPNLNHLFQECDTGSPREYKKIEQTISPVALNEMVNWIKTK